MAAGHNGNNDTKETTVKIPLALWSESVSLCFISVQVNRNVGRTRSS